MIRVGIVGAGGYGGAELVRLLLQHPDCGKENLLLFSSSLHSVFTAPGRFRGEGPGPDGSCDGDGSRHSEGHCEDYANHCPAFYGLGLTIYGLPGRDAESEQWWHFFCSFDVVFLAVPHAVSAELAAKYFRVKEQFGGRGESEPAKLIDLSGALRLDQAEIYRQWYEEETLGDELLGCCQYGLSELFRDDIRQANVIANPGCYATAVILALAPLFRTGFGSGARVRIDAKSGVSGAGKKAVAATHFARTNESLSLYKLHRHQHIPEIEMALSRCAGQTVAPLTFTTHLLPVTRGIMATCYIEPAAGQAGLNRGAPDEGALREIYRDFYADSPFVQVRPVGAENGLGMPQIQDVSFSNRCDIGLSCDPRNGELLVVSAIDNLLKGAAGQALQNMNLMFGREEQRGLPLAAALP
ncbi:N-acetyl-gamma-glutamyl-phosphate reductase [Candidatus Haliotispira prima]|uniref:N-acetyl-gamma-glutamyl-phosphate reductase n=1 Tax=Candidatus Haliotispira prima TaxID=3034016 RepID=A0ABY8MK86_9SPIO|nr:N-acetyl-gamma-glutamyl-phosphate reductase [Candidatus Haliotispira prima]